MRRDMAKLELKNINNQEKGKEVFVLKKKAWLSVLLAVFMILTLIPVTAFAEGNTITVEQGGSLQDALNEAQSGDTIVLPAGTFAATANEQFRISKNDLTIKGAGADTIIDAGEFSSSSQAGVLVEADNVSIQDLTIRSTAKNGNVSALKFSKIGDGTTLPMITEGTVKNVTISSDLGHALNIHGVTKMTVDGLKVTKAGKLSISMASAKEVTVSNTTTYEGTEEAPAWGSDIGIMWADRPAYNESSKLVIGSGNNFGETAAFYTSRPASAGADAIEISDDADLDLVMTISETGAWAVVEEDAENPAPVVNTSTGMKFNSLEDAVKELKDGEKLELTANVTVDKMLNIDGLSNVTIDLKNFTVTASDSFSGAWGNNNDRHLVQIVNAENVTIANGSLKTTAQNKHTLNVYDSKGVVLENVKLYHEASITEGAPLIIANSSVSVKGNLAVTTGDNSWYGINLDSKGQKNASLTFEEDATITFTDNSEAGDKVLLFTEDSSAAEGEEPVEPTVDNKSDDIKLDKGEDGSYDMHSHKTETKNAKEATCTEEGYTGDLVCTECGEVVEKGKVIEKIAHNYVDGKCTVCGAADPNYTAGGSDSDNTSDDAADGSDPQMGDSLNIMLLVALMLLAAGGTAGTYYVSKARKSGKHSR